MAREKYGPRRVEKMRRQLRRNRTPIRDRNQQFWHYLWNFYARKAERDV